MSPSTTADQMLQVPLERTRSQCAARFVERLHTHSRGGGTFLFDPSHE